MTEALVQPHDLRAEEELLGSALTTECFGAVQADVGLKAESFFRETHQVIWLVMQRLRHEGKPITPITVSGVLQRDHAVDTVDWRLVVDALSLPASPGHAIHYAEIVRDKARWRRRFDGGLLLRQAAAAEDDELFTEAQAKLSDDPSHQKALYDADRQRDLVYELIEGKAKAEFFWPFDKLNRLQSGGMRRGQLNVLSGYTNEGKSHFAGQLLDLNRKHGKVCLYDNEMDPAEQAARRATRLGGVPYGPLLDGGLDERDTKAAMKYLNSDLHWPIVDTSGWTVEDVCLHIRQYRWDFVVIDILHNFPFDDERQLSASVARLKAAARLARCCIVLVAHVNRGGVERGHRRRPIRSDLRWSGDIENLADSVCFVYRKQDEDTLEPTEEGFVYFDKCRGGKLGAQAVVFNGSRLKFEVFEELADPSISVSALAGESAW